MGTFCASGVYFIVTATVGSTSYSSDNRWPPIVGFRLKCLYFKLFGLPSLTESHHIGLHHLEPFFWNLPQNNIMLYFLIFIVKGYEIKTKVHDKGFNVQDFSSLEEERSFIFMVMLFPAMNERTNNIFIFHLGKSLRSNINFR